MKSFRFASIIMIFTALLMASAVAMPIQAFAQDEVHTPVPISLDEPDDAETNATAENSRILMLDDEINDETADAFASDDTEDETDGDEEYSDENTDDENTDDETEIAKENTDSPVKGHGLQLGMSFIGVPDYIFDAWFAEHGSVWKDGAVNMGVSLDYTLRFERPCEMRFSLSWVNAKTSSAYWLDKNFVDRPYLADYFVNNYSIIALEVAAYHMIPIIDEIAFYYGGGFWGGVILGDSENHAIRSSCANSADNIQVCPYEPGSVPLTQLPPVFGFVTVTLGYKFTLLDIMTIRAEGGFKGYFYGQVGLGVEF